MSTLKNILIKLETYHKTENQGACRLFLVLNEIADKLTALISSGQNGIFDLNRELLTSGDIDELKNILGRGEVEASLNVLGKTTIRETGVAGIWWITHTNEQGSVIRECIEITTCPDLLKTFPDELDAAVAGLQYKIHQYTRRSTSDQVARRLSELGFGVDSVQNEIV
ncbi:hydrogenase expression/formation C-terminal domain-containing protein [Methylomonas sp. MgM2]